MKIKFADGTVLSAVQISEDKKIYSAPQKWELKVTSDSEVTSDFLDGVLTPENISKIVYTKDDGEISEFNGYNYVDKVSKVYSSSGITLNIVLQKEIEKNED